MSSYGYPYNAHQVRTGELGAANQSGSKSMRMGTWELSSRQSSTGTTEALAHRMDSVFVTIREVEDCVEPTSNMGGLANQ